MTAKSNKAVCKALSFAVQNLQYIAKPCVNRAGKITSIPRAISMAKAALRRGCR